MIKVVKFSLIICSFILTALLVVNIIKYNNNLKNNNNLIDTTNNYQNKIKDNNTKKEQLETELISLKEEKKDKIWEYDRWIKWNQEIKEKIN